MTSISMWETLRPECSGTGIYESRLASLYIELGDYEKALPIIESGIGLDSNYEKELLSALANYYLLTGGVDKSSEIAYDLVNKYPDWYGGYLLLSVVKGEQLLFEESLIAIKKANELEQSANFYSIMALSYHHLEQHEQAVKSMGHALELDPNEIRGNLAVVATAYSLMTLDRIEHAEELLYRHQLAVPESQNDPVFIKAVIYLRKKKAAVDIAD